MPSIMSCDIKTYAVCMTIPPACMTGPRENQVSSVFRQCMQSQSAFIYDWNGMHTDQEACPDRSTSDISLTCSLP